MDYQVKVADKLLHKKLYPLGVDLDGTLSRGDMTFELLILCFKWFPLKLPFIILTFFTSKAKAKSILTDLLIDHIEPANLPYEPKIIELINQYKKQDLPVELLSGTNHRIVEKIAEHLGVFTNFKGSSDTENLVSKNKLAYLKERFPEGFDYAGNSSQDFAVWKDGTRNGYGCGAPSSAYGIKDEDGNPVVTKLTDKASNLTGLIKEMRLHQWAKNILIFIVPFLVVSTMTPFSWMQAIAGFFILSFVASSTYIFNDLLDIQDDRQHVKKKFRPLAASTLEVPVAILAMGFMLLISLICAYFINLNFFGVVMVYLIVTLSYSLGFKRVAILDVFVLAALFCVRVVAGAVVINAEATTWFMTFIALAFLSLGVAKRFVEVLNLSPGNETPGRGYKAEDKAFLMTFGASVGISAVMALAIYGLLSENRVLHSQWAMLTVTAIFAAWIMRMWLIAGRGEMDCDPVLFAVKDRFSLATLGVLGSLVLYDTARPIWSSLF